MYAVEFEALTVMPSITYLPTELTEPEWQQLTDIFQMDSDQEELQEARKLAEMARKYYVNVRITKSHPNGAREVVA